MKGRTYGRKILSQLKFLECIDNHILLLLWVFHEHESPAVILNVYLQSSSYDFGTPRAVPSISWQKKMCSFPPSVVVVFFASVIPTRKIQHYGGRKYHYCPSYCDECCRYINSCTLVKRSSQTSRHHVFLFSWDYYGMKRNALLFCFLFCYLFLRLEFISLRNPSLWAIVSSYIFCFCCLHF